MATHFKVSKAANDLISSLDAFHKALSEFNKETATPKATEEAIEQKTVSDVVIPVLNYVEDNNTTRIILLNGDEYIRDEDNERIVKLTTVIETLDEIMNEQEDGSLRESALVLVADFLEQFLSD